MEPEGKYAYGHGDNMSGIAAGAVIGGKVDFQRFTADGTWNKPAGVTQVYIEVIAGGGSGGAGWTSVGLGSAGGGGGAFTRGTYPAESLPAALTVTVGDEVAGGSGWSNSAAATGNPGNFSSVTGTGVDTAPGNSGSPTFTLKVFGGGGGNGGGLAGGSYPGGSGGGGGGGVSEVGGSPPHHNTDTVANTGGDGGVPTIQGATHGNSLGGRGGRGGDVSQTGFSAEYGGGGGGGGEVSVPGDQGEMGGSSIYGAGGGGGGEGTSSVHGGGVGGAWSSYAAGGSVGGVSGGNASVGGNGYSRGYGCGDGGGGGGGSTPGHGGDGGEPGGGGGAASSGSSHGGKGARGEVRIWSW